MPFPTARIIADGQRISEKSHLVEFTVTKVGELRDHVEPEMKEGRKHAEPAIEAGQRQLEDPLNDSRPVAFADWGNAVLDSRRDVLLHNEQHGPDGDQKLQHSPASTLEY